MLIVGAGGFAREVLEIIHLLRRTDGLAFFDDVNPRDNHRMFGRFPILWDEGQVRAHFQAHGPSFTIGIGNPRLRHNMWQRFVGLGGEYVSTVSPSAHIGSFDVRIGQGCNILCGAAFSNSSGAGMGCIVYYNAIITHDCYLGDFVQVAPGVSVLGGACVDSFALIGSNATILPRLTVGRHAVVAAGSVVSRPVPDHALVIGNPARRTGWVSEYGHKINFNDQGEATCPFSGEHYRLRNDQVMKVNQGE